MKPEIRRGSHVSMSARRIDDRTQNESNKRAFTKNEARRKQINNKRNYQERAGGRSSTANLLNQQTQPKLGA
jgi:hypothetical protein